MSPERWREIEAIFNEALELGADEREEFVSNAAEEDADLAREVRKLLAQYEDASDFIEQPLYDSARTGFLTNLLDDSDDDPMVGKVLGNYRIEREIGRGGMGAVYEAVRADGEFRLRVALKVVKRGVDTDFVLRRFRNERQILAALDHPFITRLIDGGTTDDGRPYFVMEFIDGLPLYRYCDRERLSIFDRLTLFCHVCEAVEYAHQKLVIHRDLKPSNIFITNDGSPRLLDFGIAKLLDPDLAIDTLQPTATALRMMTVDYASPEQVRGERVTYATDVYSLGVILFELLTGHRPYRLNSRSPHEVARAICDDDPVMPSGAAKDPKVPAVLVNRVASTLISDANAYTPEDRSDDLRGDLDNIILKALAKMPDDRYRSVKAFREDIERYLRDEPVLVDEPVVKPKSVRMPMSDSRLLAVLPLTLLSPTGTGNTDETYLTVGLADAIITRLTSVKQLTVRPTSSITRYDDHQLNPFRAGRELGVDFVLDGRIRRFGERLRISLQLLDINNVTAIWAGQFDEHLTDVLELEDAISEQVAVALIPKLTGEERDQLAKRGTNVAAAYEAYLRGRFYWNQFTSQSLPKALEAYESAIELDPEYALAHAAIAEFYVWAGIYGLIPTKIAAENADASIRKALTIDRDLAEAHAAHGLLLNNHFLFEQSEQSFLRSIAINPQYALAREWYGALLVGTGRFEQGLEEMLLAERLDPMSLRTKILVVWYHYQMGLFEEALRKAEEIVEMDRNYPQGHLQRGNLLSILGRHDEALESIALADGMMKDSALVQYTYCFAYHRAGRVEDALRLADEMELRSTTEFVKPYFLAMANLAAGRLERAFELLETAVEEREAWLAWMGTDPKLKILHDDPRFKRLLRATRREIVDGRVRAIDAKPFERRISEADTAKMYDSPETSSNFVFLRRNRWLLGVGAAAVLLIAGAYFTGFLSVSITSQPPIVQRSGETRRSVAVLPFKNETADPENDFLCDGLSDTLIARLAYSSDIQVMPRSASFAYRSSSLTPRQAGGELKADVVLTGKLAKKDGQNEITVEAIDVVTGTRVWGFGYRGTDAELVFLQNKMSDDVSEKLGLGNTRQVAAKTFTQNPEAFEHYLKGEYHRQKGTPEDTRKSIEFYKKALEFDPNYALAFQGLALAYRMAPAYGTYSPQDSYPMAKEAALKALAIDPQLGSAHIPLASIKFVYDWDFAGAEAEYKRAIQLLPSNAESHYSYGNFLVAMGRHDEALNELRIAQQFDPLSLTISSNIAWALYVAGRFDEAEAQAKLVLSRDPNYARGYQVLGEVYQEQGKFNESIAHFQKAKQISDDTISEMALGHVYATAGRRAEAEKIAAELERKVMRKEISPFLPAVVYAGLDDKDKAFYWLERAYQERSNWLSLIKAGRRLKNLRPDPRFDDLLKRVGF